MTIDHLRERCAYWQQVLRLQDWQIVLELCRAADIDGDYGECDANPRKKLARIRIAREEDRDESWCHAVNFDQERTLVHELLHLMPALAKAGPDIEQTTHLISLALIALDRKAA